jgi:hypothetical protein
MYLPCGSFKSAKKLVGKSQIHKLQTCKSQKDWVHKIANPQSATFVEGPQISSPPFVCNSAEFPNIQTKPAKNLATSTYVRIPFRASWL